MHGQTILMTLLFIRNVINLSVTRIISEDARKSTKINVDSIEPTLSDSGNECFWPNLLQIIQKKGPPHLTSILRTSLSCEIFLFLLFMCQNKKRPLKKLQKITPNKVHTTQLIQKPAN